MVVVFGPLNRPPRAPKVEYVVADDPHAAVPLEEVSKTHRWLHERLERRGTPVLPSVVVRAGSEL